MVMRFWLVQLCALGTLLLFVSLGTWQLQRGNVKHGIETKQADSSASVQIQVMPTAPYDKWRYKQIQLQGYYRSKQQFLLDNQIRDRSPGYAVLTPFYSQAYDQWMLVDRGWIAQGITREQLPSIVLDEQPRTISGSVYVPYDDSFTLGDIAEGEDYGWPRRIQYVDYEAIGERLGLELLPFTVRLNADQTDGYRRDWVASQMSSQKHYGYAFQWFAMAIAIIVLWWLYSIKPLLSKKG